MDPSSVGLYSATLLVTKRLLIAMIMKVIVIPGLKIQNALITHRLVQIKTIFANAHQGKDDLIEQKSLFRCALLVDILVIFSYRNIK